MYKVMIVDDETWILRGLERQIKEASDAFTSIRLYDQPLKALIALEKTPADLLFIDIHMGGLTGLEFIEHAKSFCPDAIYVIISAFSNFSYAQTAIKLGVEEYLVKPITQSDLHSVLRQAKRKLDNKRAIQDADDLAAFLSGELQSKDALIKAMGFSGDGVYRCWAAIHPTKRDFRAMLSSHVRDLCVFQSRSKDFQLAVTRHADTASCRACLDAVSATPSGQVVRIGASGVVTDLEGLHEALLHAQWGALQYFITPASSLTVIDTVQPPQKTSSDTCALLQNATAKQRTELLNRWYLQTVEANLPIYQAYHQAYEILQVLYSLAFSPALAKHMLSMTSPISMVHNFHSLRALTDAVITCVNGETSQVGEGVTADGIRDYIKQNFRKPLRVSGIAKHFFMDAGYIGRLFRSHNGIGITEYIHTLRMQYAAKLLEETTLDINQIASQCGIGDYFYFTKIFKKTYGTTPSQYRKNKNCI